MQDLYPSNISSGHHYQWVMSNEDLVMMAHWLARVLLILIAMLARQLWRYSTWSYYSDIFTYLAVNIIITLHFDWSTDTILCPWIDHTLLSISIKSNKLHILMNVSSLTSLTYFPPQTAGPRVTWCTCGKTATPCSWRAISPCQEDSNSERSGASTATWSQPQVMMMMMMMMIMMMMMSEYCDVVTATGIKISQRWKLVWLLVMMGSLGKCFNQFCVKCNCALILL